MTWLTTDLPLPIGGVCRTKLILLTRRLKMTKKETRQVTKRGVIN